MNTDAANRKGVNREPNSRKIIRRYRCQVRVVLGLLLRTLLLRLHFVVFEGQFPGTIRVEDIDSVT